MAGKMFPGEVMKLLNISRKAVYRLGDNELVKCKRNEEGPVVTREFDADEINALAVELKKHRKGNKRVHGVQLFSWLKERKGFKSNEPIPKKKPY